MGFMISIYGYAIEMFWRIELNAGEITTINTNQFLSLADSRRVAVSYKREYVHKVLVNCLVKLA